MRRAVLVLLLVLACRDRAPAPADRRDAVATASAIPPFQGRIDLGRWIRDGPVGVGCWMQEHLAYRDPRWNCSAAAAPPPADPCDDAGRVGPEIPEPVARRVHPLLRRITLSWERGALQGATFAFDPDVPPDAMPRILRLDAGTADAVAWNGRGQCDTPCWRVVVFAPGAPECEEADDADEGDE